MRSDQSRRTHDENRKSSWNGFFLFKIYEQKSDDDDNTFHRRIDHPEGNIDDRHHHSTGLNNPKEKKPIPLLSTLLLTHLTTIAIQMIISSHRNDSNRFIRILNREKKRLSLNEEPLVVISHLQERSDSNICRNAIRRSCREANRGLSPSISNETRTYDNRVNRRDFDVDR